MVNQLRRNDFSLDLKERESGSKNERKAFFLFNSHLVGNGTN